MQSKKKQLFKGRIIVVLLAPLLLFGALLYNYLFGSPSTFAIAKAGTISLNLSTNNLSLDLVPKSNGVFGKSDTVTISTKTDNFTGYTLSIVSTNSSNLEDGNGNVITSLGQATSETNFSSNQNYNNQWGYLPSQYVVSNNGVDTVVENTTTYLPAPSSTGDNLDITSAANSVNNTYTIRLGARVDTTLPSGTYSNSFSIVAISNSSVYNITYDKNTPNQSETVSNMPTPNPQAVDIPMGTPTADSYAILNSATPARVGYTFAGWCDVATTIDPATNSQICSGTTYQAGGNYGIDQTQDGTNIRLFAIWQANQYNITITPSTGISSIVVKQNNTTICTITNSNTCSLYHGVAYDITATPATGYNFNNWSDSKDSSAIGNANLATTTYTPSDPTSVLTASATAKTYTITLNKNGATNTPTASTTATYNATTLASIATLPVRSYSVNGFTKTASANDSTVSSTTALTSNYTFNGWYKESGATNKIASNAATPALQASTTYTNSSKQWINDGAVTLYAGWSGQSVTLPTITRTGSTCGWATSSTATTITYASGASFTPTANTTLYGVCVNSITLNNSGATTAGSTSATVNYNATSLSNITLPQRKITVSGFTKTTSADNSTVSSTSTLTNTATFNGWYTASSGGTKIAAGGTDTTPALQASTTYTDANSKWTYATADTVTLYSQWNDNAVTLPTITRTGSTCGWSTSSTASTITYASGASITPTANTTLYGVCVTNITLNANGGSGGSTSTTANCNSTTLAAITNPTRANTTGTRTVSGFTKTTSATNATVSSTSTLNSTNTTTYTFNGWYKESGATNKIASNATTPALQASTTYTNSSKQWTYTTAGAITLYAGWTASAGAYSAVTLPTITRTGSTCGWSTSSTATTISYASGASFTPTANTTLYGVCRNNITLNANGGSGGSTSTTVNYNATTLGTITNPTRANSTYTVSGFTLTTSGANATVSSTANKTSTQTYTFNGWYKESGATNKIASNATTPALQASTTYTNSSKQWTYTTAGAITLYAGWTASGYSAVTLPTITRTGSTCGWSTSNTATTWSYNSGASITPTGNLTLYGVCRNNITLNANGGSGGSTSTTATYGATTLAAITNPTRANTTGTRTVSGFTKTTSATNATVSSTSTLNSTNTTTYTFNGWYKESGATNKIASNATTPALQASTTYTNSSKQWTYTTAGAITLYAGWTASAGAYSAVTLPTITRTGSTCGWSTSSTATTISYASGASFTPTANTTLYGVCRNNITLNANGGSGGSTSTTATYGATSLAAITNPTRANTTGTRTVSGFTKTTSATNATVSSTSTLNSTNTTTYTFNGWYKESGATNKIASNATTPALQASTTYTNSSKQWTYTTAGAITLYAGWTASAGAYSAVTLPTITRTGSTCGWSTSSTATTISYASGASFTPTANTTLYGVCRNNITLNANGGSGGSTSTTVNYNATTLGTITNPTRANSTYTVSGFTLTTSGANATVSSTANKTSTQTYTFNGWYKESGATNKIASNATTPALQASTTYTNSSKQWTYTTAGAITLYAGWTASGYSAVTLPTITRTGSTCGWSTSSTATTWSYNSGASFTPTANTTLYGVCRNNITLNGNGATTAGSTSATVNYNATSLSSITLPQRKYTVSGFTLPATNNTSGAVVSSTSTLTVNYTFNGWYKESGATNKIASNATTPALQASTTYTNSSKQWTYTTASAVTLYAGWSSSATILPTITKTGGFTCGWTTTATNATNFQYASGASFTPTANTTLYGACKCPANKICYDTNATSGVTGTMGGQTISSSDTSAVLTASNYSRVNSNNYGYGFAGWSTTAISSSLASNNNGANVLNVPSGTKIYGPNETISFNAGAYATNGLTLYAAWVNYDDYMDSWVINGKCNKLNMGDVTAVIDRRDNNAYAVSKLADNKCWMIENLRLNNTGANNTSGANAQGYATNFKGLASPETANFANTTTSNTLYSTSNITGSNQGYRFPRYNNSNTGSRATNPTSNNAALYSYGNYYTWSAAVADIGDYTAEHQGIPYTSICPNKWHLSTGGTKANFQYSDYWVLTVAITGAYPNNLNTSDRPNYVVGDDGPRASNALRKYPHNFVLSGYISNTEGGIANRGTIGTYTTSTVYSGTRNYGLDFQVNYVNPGTHPIGDKFYGFTMRCLASSG